MLTIDEQETGAYQTSAAQLLNLLKVDHDSLERMIPGEGNFDRLVYFLWAVANEYHSQNLNGSYSPVLPRDIPQKYRKFSSHFSTTIFGRERGKAADSNSIETSASNQPRSGKKLDKIKRKRKKIAFKVVTSQSYD